jgi:hypothetical protein
MQIEVQSKTSAKEIAFRFPGDVLSTTAEDLRNSLDQVLQTPAAFAGSSQYFDADLRAARMVDSVGLNLLGLALESVTARGAARDCASRALISSVPFALPACQTART